MTNPAYVRTRYDGFTMNQRALSAECPECHSEIPVSLGTEHRPFGDNEKMMYRLICPTCGLDYDVHFEDLHLSDKA